LRWAACRLDLFDRNRANHGTLLLKDQLDIRNKAKNCAVAVPRRLKKWGLAFFSPKEPASSWTGFFRFAGLHTAMGNFLLSFPANWAD
jgi:hypothetical protein